MALFSKRLLPFFPFIYLLLLPQTIYADTLRISTDEWCPYDCVPAQNNGKIGYLGELLIAAMQARGHKVEFVEVSYSRGLTLVREGKLNGTTACVKEDAPDFVYTPTPQGKSNATFFSRAGSNWRYTGTDSLKQAKMIGVIKGYDYVDPTVMSYLNQNPENVLKITGERPLERLLQMLISGRLTAIIEDKTVTEYKLKQMNKTGQVVVSGDTPVVINVYIGFSPAIAKSAEYAKILEEEIAKMRLNGQLQKILAPYGMQDWQQIPHENNSK